MKKALLALAFVFLTTGLFAQGKGKDYVTMKQDGKMYWIRGGQTIKMGIYVPLKNGDFVYPDGSIKTKDGQVTHISQGDKIRMDGTVMPGRNQKQNRG